MENERMILRLIVVLLAILCSSASANPVPDWVEQLALPDQTDSPEDHTNSGVMRLLTDRQIKLTSQGYEDYRRRVVRITGRMGLEDEGALSFDFDPAHEELVIHDVWRVRDGKRSLITGLSFEEFRRERQMDYGVLDGHRTRYADLPDLRVGDIVDVAATRRGRHSVFPNHFAFWAAEHPPTTYQVDRLRLLTDPDQAISITGPADPVERMVGPWIERTWLHENESRGESDSGWVDWDALYGYTQVTTTSTWADIVAKIDDVYVPQPLPQDLADMVNGFSGTTAQKISQALHYTQDEIRYMSIGIGEGGFVPRAPSVVSERRFGDCKDKSLLLVSMLAEIGVKADVVLVSSDDGETLDERAPSPFLFDHAIVRVLGDGDPYFLDPTDVLQGGTGQNTYVPDYGWGLPLFSGSDRLIKITTSVPEEPYRDVVSRYELKEDGPYAAELFETTVLRGESADLARYYLERDGLEERRKDRVDWRGKRFEGITAITPMTVTDDREANVITYVEHYGIPEEAMSEHRDEFWLNPYATINELEELPDGKLDMPYPLDPLHNRHRVELVGDDTLTPPPEYRISNAFFIYTRDGYQIPGGIGADFRIEVLTPEIRPEDAEAYRAAYDDQDSHDSYRYRLSSANRVMKTTWWFGLSVERWIQITSIFACGLILLLAIRAGYRAAQT